MGHVDLSWDKRIHPSTRGEKQTVTPYNSEAHGVRNSPSPPQTQLLQPAVPAKDGQRGILAEVLESTGRRSRWGL